MYVGLVDLNVAGNHTQWFEVNRVIIHPTYELYHPVGGDIALVQLKTRIVFSDSVLPICIAPPDLTLWHTQWGRVVETASAAVVLHKKSYCIHVGLSPVNSANLDLLRESLRVCLDC